MASFEDALGGLSPENRKRLLDAGMRTPKRLATPSLGLTLALKGGFGEGRQIFLWGAKSAGKSSFCLAQVAIAQQQGLSVAWVDVENSFETTWARTLGVDTEKLLLTNTKTADKMADLVVNYCQAGVDVVIVDSISALLPPSYIEDSKKKGDAFELKPMANTGQIGSESKAAGAYMKMFNAVNESTIIILISQARTAFAGQHATFAPTGGHAAKYYSSQIIKLWSSESKDNTIRGLVTAGDKVFETDIGRKVIWRVEFNKLGPQGRTGEYNFFYDGEHIGIDAYGETVELAEKYGVLHFAGGGWTEWDGQKIQGKPNLAEWLRENPQSFEKLQGELRERI